MRLGDTFIAVVGFALSIATLFFDALTIELKAICILAIICLTLFGLLICSRRKYKKISSQLEERRRNHKALSMQFDEKLKTIDSYRDGFLELSLLLNATMMSSRNDRFLLFQDRFYAIKNKYFSEDDNNGQDV